VHIEELRGYADDSPSAVRSDRCWRRAGNSRSTEGSQVPSQCEKLRQNREQEGKRVSIGRIVATVDLWPTGNDETDARLKDKRASDVEQVDRTVRPALS